MSEVAVKPQAGADKLKRRLVLLFGLVGLAVYAHLSFRFVTGGKPILPPIPFVVPISQLIAAESGQPQPAFVRGQQHVRQYRQRAAR